LKYKG
jgi:hypothetical protein